MKNLNMPLPISEEKLQELAEGGRIEYLNYNPRSKSGMREWEIKICRGDGMRKILVMYDSGFSVTVKQVEITPYDNLLERNREICRLYRDEKISQSFLSKLFNISQPAVSQIVNGRGKADVNKNNGQ